MKKLAIGCGLVLVAALLAGSIGSTWPCGGCSLR